MDPTAELLAAAKRAVRLILDDFPLDACSRLEDAIEAFEKDRRRAENGPDHDGEAWEGGFAANH